jgi:type I restriction enzyme R subunit
VGLDRGAAKDAFSKYLDTTRFNANQIRFIEMVIDHLTRKGTMDAGMLYEEPFTGIHYEGVEGVFEDAVVGEIISVIRAINANAEGSSVA